MEGRCPGHIWIRLKKSKVHEFACGRPGCGATKMVTPRGSVVFGRPGVTTKHHKRAEKAQTEREKEG